MIGEITTLKKAEIIRRFCKKRVVTMKLFSNVLKLAAAASIGLSLAGFATTADAAMMHKMTKKEMKMAEMHCKEMHGMMMHGKCDMMKKKK